MKSIATAMIAASLALSSQPAAAADFSPDTAASQRPGTFAGARLRLPLGGGKAHKPRAELGIAPVMQGRMADGSVRTRFGEGVQLSLTGGESASVRVGGVDLAQRWAAAEEGKKKNKTGKAAVTGALIVGGVLVGLGVAYLVVRSTMHCNDFC